MHEKVLDWMAERRWWFDDIGLPFLVTRIGLILVGWVSVIIPPADTMPARGWHFSPHRLLDIWGRWDTGWYISIIEHGYTTETNQFGQGNTAFFPLYSYLVKLLHNNFIPTDFQTRGTVLFVGVVVSNLAFLGALTLLHLLISIYEEEHRLAQKAALYLCVFPTSFIFSAFYTEALFLLLSLVCFYAAEKETWWLAGVAGGLTALTRPTGVLIALSLGILYGKKKQKIEPDVLAIGLVPAALLVLVAILYAVTGDPLEILNSHAGWNHQVALPWQTFRLSPSNPILGIDQMMMVFFIIMAFASFRFGLSYGFWAIANTLLMLVIKGNPKNMTRYVSVAFPAFVVLSTLSERYPRLHQLVLTIFTMLLALLMALWCQYYKVI
jgi:hypothetical protein